MLDDFKNAFQRHNNAHVQLIIINVIVFAIMGVFMVISQISQSSVLQSLYEVVNNQFSIPARFETFITHPWTLITYAFAHAGVSHILFNMLALYWFGSLFVEYLGSDKMIAVYFLGALAGGLLYLLAYNTVPYFVNQSNVSMVGASAAVNAIIVAAATLLPEYTFFLLFLGPVKIKYIAAVAVFLSFLGTVGGNAGGNIAHLGGALIGFVYIKQLQSGVNWGGWITATIDWFKNLFTAKPKVKVTYRNKETPSPKKGATKSSVSQDEIDVILDKISDGGYESLTKDEKEKLFNASKK